MNIWKNMYIKKRYLIVLDDVWGSYFWDDHFKDRRGDKAAKGSCLLLTTRVEYVANNICGSAYFYTPFLKKEECWELLHRKVFGDKVCPTELQNAGVEIAKKCEGLPLMVVTVGNILLEAESTPNCWNRAANNKNNPVFEDAYKRIMPVLYLSYNHLSPRQKACFLYMGAFPPSYQVSHSKLDNLWCIEGFLEPEDGSTLEDLASECFDDLNYNHVVVPAGHMSSNDQDYQACSLPPFCVPLLVQKRAQEQ